MIQLVINSHLSLVGELHKHLLIHILGSFLQKIDCKIRKNSFNFH
jgi:hypothetical protein